jgi:plastocyanin
MSYGAQLGAAVALVWALTGCRPERPSTDNAASPGASAETSTSAPAAITVTANDYSFDAPAEIPAGLTTVRLVNKGTELHHAQIMKIEGGKTMDDVTKALKSHGPPPSWVKFVGGPNAAAPGQETQATSVLAPGNYVYLCFIPSGDREIHAAKGMVKPFTVTAASSVSTAQLPESGLTITMLDYDFKLSQPLTPGRHTIRVENAGPQAHELALLKLNPGKTVADFLAWDEGGMKGPPPAQPEGGVVMLDKDGSATFSADLTAGEYALMCFVPDSKDGKPHFAHGMMKTIKVG